MIALSVNVNKIATLRNARGGSEPSVTAFARAAIEAGADGITVHPRPDERHIRRADVFELQEVIGGVEFNIEGYPDRRFLEIVREARPDQATLVPDPPDVLTSNAGWDARGHRDFLREVIAELHGYGARVSIFMETDLAQIEAAKETGTDRIELYTGPYAEAFDRGDGLAAYQPYAAAAEAAVTLGLGVNAGHDLNQRNLSLFRQLPGLAEVSIGHAITCDALVDGFKPTIRNYRLALGRRASQKKTP